MAIIDVFRKRSVFMPRSYPSLDRESYIWRGWGTRYTCLRIKGIHRRYVRARGSQRGKGGMGQRRIPSPFRRLCSTLSDMLTDRRSDARTNLFSIRPMHFKLIVPRFRYSVVILCLVLLKQDGTIIAAGRSKKVCCRFYFFKHLWKKWLGKKSAPFKTKSGFSNLI